MQKDEKINFRWLFFLIAAVIVLWVVSGYLIYPLGIEERGVFGDMFGAVNSLFSGLAFATLIFTIYLQTHAIKLQQKELEDTRNEIRQQKEYLAAQNDVMRIQNFESTFFQLLSLLQQIRESFTFTRTGSQNLGKKAFGYAYDNLEQCLREYIAQGIPAGKTKNEVINIVATNFFTEYQIDFGHYFRTLYNLIKLVDKSELPDKKFYTNLIRAQLTNIEVQVIFYDCLSDLGKEKFKPLIEKYALLKVIKPEMLFDKYHYSLYCESAFK